MTWPPASINALLNRVSTRTLKIFPQRLSLISPTRCPYISALTSVGFLVTSKVTQAPSGLIALMPLVVTSKLILLKPINYLIPSTAPNSNPNNDTTNVAKCTIIVPFSSTGDDKASDDRLKESGDD